MQRQPDSPTIQDTRPTPAALRGVASHEARQPWSHACHGKLRPARRTQWRHPDRDRWPAPPPPTFRSSAPPQWKAACSRAVQRLADRCQQACRRSCQAAGREDAAVQLLNRPALQRRRRHGIMVESWASDCPWAAFVKGPHPWKDNVTCLTRRPRPERATSDGRPVSHARGHGETGHRRLASQKPVLTWRFSRSMHVATGRATQSTRHVLP